VSEPDELTAAGSRNPVDRGSAGGGSAGGGSAGGGSAGGGSAGGGSAGGGSAGRSATAMSAHPALRDYEARNARAMRRYAAVLAILVLAAVITVRAAYAHGELTHVSGRTAAPPAAIPTGSTADSIAPAWRTDDRPAAGTPVQDGVVVTYDSHSVHGLDARTGKLRWYYTRSDQTICSVLQQDASTIAIYNRHGNCDEVTGLVTATGAVKWLRTMTDNGITQAASAPNVVLTVAQYSVHVIDNAGGLDRWDWVAPDRCSVDRALAGSQGVLISTTCGSLHRLVLRGLTSDDLTWSVNVPRAMVPVAASSFIGALDPTTGELHSYSLNKGTDTVTGRLAEPGGLRAPLAGLPRAATTVDGLTAGGETVEVLMLGRLYSFAKNGTVNWSAAAGGPATVVGPDVLAAFDDVTVHRYAGSTGKVQAVVTLTQAMPGAFRAFPVGNGLLLAGPDTRMYR
jgi:outer membrane protein assembly factor BamB